MEDKELLGIIQSTWEKYINKSTDGWNLNQYITDDSIYYDSYNQRFYNKEFIRQGSSTDGIKVETEEEKKLRKIKEEAEAKIREDICNTRTAIEKFLKDNFYEPLVYVKLFNTHDQYKIVINRFWFVANRKKSFRNYFDDVEKHDKWLIEYLQGYCILNEVTDLYFQNGSEDTDKLTRYKLPFGTL